MANVRIDNVLLTATPTDAHTIGGGVVGQAMALEFLNTDTVNRKVTVWLLPTGETRGDEHKFMDLNNVSVLKPGAYLRVLFQNHLQAGDKIQWAADVATKVRAGGSVQEVTKAGHINIKNQFLSSSLTQIGSLITTGFNTTVISIALCNISLVDQGVEVQIVPQGQSAAVKHRHIDVQDKLSPGETRIFRWALKFEGAGAAIQALADTNTAVTISGGVFEE